MFSLVRAVYRYLHDARSVQLHLIVVFRLQRVFTGAGAGSMNLSSPSGNSSVTLENHMVDSTAVHARPDDRPIVAVHVGQVSPDRRRGGEIRTLLSPRSAGAVSGFSGVASLQPGERIAEHYHPYSEEFLYVVQGELTADLDGEPWPLAAGAALLIPPGTRHRVRNVGTAPAMIVFHLGPLAPRPELGHVDTEDQNLAGHLE
jgi:putative monooxygenase